MPRNSKLKTLTLQLYTLALIFVLLSYLTIPINAAGVCGNTPSFSSGGTISVGNNPRSAVVGNFNGDANPDLVVANLDSNYISVMLGNSTNGFDTANTITVGNRLAAVAVGDFNGDNKTDLAVSSLATTSRFDPYIFILLGNGVGGFTVVSSFYIGGLVETIAVADFNNDGKTDLAFGDQYNGGNVILRLGDGTGNFSSSGLFRVGARIERIIARDFNGDGKPDVAATNSDSNSISVLLNNGTGGFGPATRFTSGPSPAGLVAGDFNNDGKLDLTVANRYQSVSILLGNGAGGFSAPTSFPTGKNLSSIATADFNSDGKLDVVMASDTTQDVIVILGDGLGGFGTAVSFDVGGGSTSVAVGDFNHDGNPDLVTSRAGVPGSVAIMLNSCGVASPSLPGISVSDVTMEEGNDNPRLSAIFTVSLSAASTQRVTVSYATAPGTATPIYDFTMISGTITFEIGETAKTIGVPIEGDGVDEFDETFTLNLSNPVGGTIVRGQGTCTLLDDDPPPIVSIRDTSPLPEGDSGTSTVLLSVFLNTTSPKSITVNYATADGTAIAGSDYLAASGSVTFAPGETVKTIGVQLIGDTVNEANETFFVNLFNPVNVTIGDGQGIVTIFNDDTPTLRWSQNNYNVGEEAGSLNVTVTRSGDPSIPVTVNYATSDVAGLQDCNVINRKASSRCDYATVVGTLRFAAGDTSKAISIPIVDDVYVEGTEGFFITLSNPSSSAVLGSQPTSTILITDNGNDSASAANPIDQTPFFVRQHYIDFLGREPDSFGYKGWQDILNNCAAGDTTCDRIEVSSGFFRSAEFQERGYFTYRFYSVALGRKPGYAEFMPDLAKVSGFLSDAEKEANKVAFIAEFMNRQEFKNKYDSTINNPTAYVDALLQTAGLPNHPSRAGWIAGLTAGTLTRARVLRELAESSEVYNKFYNEAFVVMQYFGYLRRDPDILYLDWVKIMNQNPTNYRGMVNGFMNSLEYRLRFGP